jgi:outer membrane protein
MSKITHLIIYSLLFVSIFILFILQFNQDQELPNGKNNPSKIGNKNIIKVKEEPSPINQKNHLKDSISLRIAYVNSDTVSKYYKYAQKVQASLLGKRNAAEKQIKNKYQSYENLVKEFEKASPIMGEREKMEKAQKIRLLEQEIMKVEQELSQQLANEEIIMTQSYVVKTNEYMQIIGQRLGFDYVLSYRMGGPMLYANSALDITSNIIDLLNVKYQSDN